MSARMRRMMSLSGVPKRFLSAAPGDFDTGVHLDRSLFLTGPVGTGKTHYLCAVINGMKSRRAATGCLFVSVVDLLARVRACYSPGPDQESEQEIVRRYSEVDVLCLDDLGAAKSTDWAVQVLCQIIDFRYREEKLTVISSNLSLAEIDKQIDARIASRIAGMCELLALEGADRRI